jgi:hypothetical protein
MRLWLKVGLRWTRRSSGSATSTVSQPPKSIDGVIAIPKEDRAAIAALPKDQRYVTPPFATDWNAPTL